MNDFPIIKNINDFIENLGDDRRAKYTKSRSAGADSFGFMVFDKLDLDFDNSRQVLMGDNRVKKPPLKETSRKAIKSTFNNAIKKYRQNWYENIYQKYPKGKVVQSDRSSEEKKIKTLSNFPNTRLGNDYGFLVRNEDAPSMIRGLESISKLLDIVKSADFEEFLKQTFKNENTLRNYYSAVIYFLEQVKQADKPKKTQKKFNRLREEINNSLGEKQGKLTERQKENALPQEKLQKEIEEKINPLIDEIEKIEDVEDADITPKQLTAYKYFVILTTYMVLPMRNELATIKSGLYREYQEQTKIDKKTKGLKEKDVNRPYLEGNWYLIDTDKKSYLLFNRYKTDGKYGARLIELPADLARMYNRYMAITNNQKNEPVFNMTNNALSTFMGRQGLKYFGKRITPNLLRTIYYSGKYQPQSFRSFTEMSKALKADGKTQGTSVPTLIRSYIKDIGKKDKELKNDPKPSKEFKKTLRGKKPVNYKPVQTLEEAKAQDLVEE